MPNPSEVILGFREEEKKVVVLVNSSADKQDLPRFRLPKVKALRPACLVLIEVAYRGYNGDIGRCDLARVSGGRYERVPGR